MFPVLPDQICTHCTRGLGPLLHADLLQIYQASGSSIPPQVFYWTHIWSLARPIQDFEMLVKLCSYSSYPGNHDLSQLLFLREGDCCPKSATHLQASSLQSMRSPLQKGTPKHVSTPTPIFLHCTFLCTKIIEICFFLLFFHL